MGKAEKLNGYCIGDVQGCFRVKTARSSEKDLSCRMKVPSCLECFSKSGKKSFSGQPVAAKER